MSECFSLLSEKLLEIKQHAEETKTPVLGLWLERGLGYRYLEKGEFDEEELLEIVDKMLGNTDCFCFEPASVEELRNYLGIIHERKDLYLIFALSAQKRRISRLIDSIGNGSLDKRISDLKKYIRKAELQLEAILSVEEKKRLDDSIRMRINNFAVRKTRNLDMYRQMIEEIFNLDGGTCAEFEKISREVLEKHKAQVEKLEKAIIDMNLELSVLEPKVQFRNRLEGLLHDTKARLIELQPIQDGSNGNAAYPDIGKNEQSDTSDCDKPIENNERELEGDCASDPQSDKVFSIGKDGKRTKDSDRPFSRSIEPGRITDTQRLKKIVELANNDNLAIRLMAPSDHINRFKKQWETVLSFLGFRGEVIIVDYSFLSRTSDYDSPVIVPKKMNTHHEKWDRGAFSNLVVVEVSSPRLLLAIISKNSQG